MRGQTNPTDLLGTAEVAKRLGVNVKTIRRWIASGTLPAFRVGRRLRVSLADAVAMVERVEPADGPRLETRREREQREREDDEVLRAAGVRR